MEFLEIKNKLCLAIRDFLKNDKILLEIDVNERTIAFRLAHYLQIHFGASYDVDCEYNKYLGNTKKIYLLKDDLERINEFKNKSFSISEFLENEFNEVTVYPDIIVHKRNSKINLLIIEVKKKSSRLPEKDYDLVKLRHYTNKADKSDLSYEYGAFICFNTGSSSSQGVEIKWFQDGKEFEQQTV